MMLTDEELDKFKKSNTFKMLVKGSYLGVMEYNFKNMTKKQLVDECFKREAQIFDLKNQLAPTEKALELACKELYDSDSISICAYCPYDIEDECADECPQNTKVLEMFFKAKAKEIMKSE